MHFLSIIPKIFLAALTFSGTSQQTPVDGLEPRELSSEATYIVSGLLAMSFSLQSMLSAQNANSVGAGSLKSTLGYSFNATDSLVLDTLQRINSVLVISGEAERNAVITAETDVVTDFENLFASLASKLVTFDYLTKLFLYQAFSALKGDVLKLADQIVRTVNRAEATTNRDNMVKVFGQADTTFKVRTGNFRERE